MRHIISPQLSYMPGYISIVAAIRHRRPPPSLPPLISFPGQLSFLLYSFLHYGRYYTPPQPHISRHHIFYTRESFPRSIGAARRLLHYFSRFYTCRAECHFAVCRVTDISHTLHCALSPSLHMARRIRLISAKFTY